MDSSTATLRRGASRRTSRARHLALEAMEERLVLSTTATLGAVTISELKIISGTGVSPALTPSGGYPSPSQQAPDGGDVAKVTFTTTDHSHATVVGVADYISATYPPGGVSAYPPGPSDAVVKQWLNDQVYFASSSATLNAANNWTATLYVNLAHCQPGHEFYQQIDCYTGQDAITKFDGSNYYGFFGVAPISLIGGAVIGCEHANGPAGNFSQGYYKEQHQYALPDFMAIGNQLYSRADLVTLLKTNPSGGNATLINVHQLITAYANLANGTPSTSGITNAILQSEEVLRRITADPLNGGKGPLIINGVYNTLTFVKTSTADGKLLNDAGGYLDKNFNFA